MKKITVILFVSLIISKIGIGQDNNHSCGTEVLNAQWEDEFQRLIKDFETSGHNKKLDSNHTNVIPVIFHVIHSGQSVGVFPNIDAGQVYSQIDVLNQDFNGIGENANTYPVTAFTSWAVNEGLPSANIDSLGRVKIGCLNVQFCPALYDTIGNILPEPGIHRVDYTTLGIADPASFTTTTTLKPYLNSSLQPKTIWDVTKYLNIWVTDKNNAIMFTGVASGPPLSGLTGLSGGIGTDTTDGIWLYAKVTGSPIIYPSGIYGNPNVRGRTATHEIGHWLGLKHIWGDAACATDYCNDTPPAASDNIGIPTYPHNIGTCSSPSNSPDGEMFMNFMDYTLDPYKYMFTTDQVTRMQTAILNSPFRNQLGTHGLCSAPLTINDLNFNDNISIYPNPATQELYFSKTTDAIVFELSGKVAFSATNVDSINVSELNNGMYMLKTADGSVTKFIKQ